VPISVPSESIAASMSKGTPIGMLRHGSSYTYTRASAACIINSSDYPTSLSAGRHAGSWEKSPMRGASSTRIPRKGHMGLTEIS
jgi:hypothetical protein